MVTVQEAFSILKEQKFSLQIIEKELSKTYRYVLAQDLYAPISMPPFRQSAMDGFALGLYDGLEYEIIGEIKAGDAHQVTLLAGQAVKIFTGAPVPDSAQAVIQIEKVSVQNSVLILDEAPKPELNIRPIGEQNQQGALALAKGTLLNAACIGFLAGLGFTTIPVFSKPKIGIIVTGNELVAPGQPLGYGKIYESNSVMLQTALRDAFFTQINTYTVNDDLENTTQTIKQALIENEVVLLSG
jgi:molybdopterin molybdotransferase